MVLVDTSIWIEYIERVNPLVEKDMDMLLRTGEVVGSDQFGVLVPDDVRLGLTRLDQVALRAQRPVDPDAAGVDQRLGPRARYDLVRSGDYRHRCL